MRYFSFLLLSLLFTTPALAGNIFVAASTGSTQTGTTVIQTQEKNKAFLMLPFAKQAYHVTEARDYSKEEQALHGFKKHQAIDFALPYGTKVYAPTTGFALATYQNSYIKQGTGVKALSGEVMHYGYGYYIHFRDPKHNLFMIFAHLSSISRKIPFFSAKPRIQQGNLLGRNSGIFPGMGDEIKTEILNNPTLFKKMKLVRPGDLLGTVGVSGLEWGEDFPLEVKKAPSTPPKRQANSRDETHLHFEIFQKSELSGKVLVDPYGLYTGDLSLYTATISGGIWLRDGNGEIAFIK